MPKQEPNADTIGRKKVDEKKVQIVQPQQKPKQQGPAIPTAEKGSEQSREKEKRAVLFQRLKESGKKIIVVRRLAKQIFQEKVDVRMAKSGSLRYIEDPVIRKAYEQIVKIEDRIEKKIEDGKHKDMLSGLVAARDRVYENKKAAEKVEKGKHKDMLAGLVDARDAVYDNKKAAEKVEKGKHKDMLAGLVEARDKVSELRNAKEKDIKLADSRESGRSLWTKVSSLFKAPSKDMLSASAQIQARDKYDNKTESISNTATERNEKSTEAYQKDQLMKQIREVKSVNEAKKTKPGDKYGLEECIQDVMNSKGTNNNAIDNKKAILLDMIQVKKESLTKSAEKENSNGTNSYEKYGDKNYNGQKRSVVNKLESSIKEAKSEKDINKACQTYIDERRMLRQDFIKSNSKEESLSGKTQIMQGKENIIRKENNNKGKEMGNA